MNEQDEKDLRFSRTQCCGSCPFGRATKPGTTGGSEAEVYIAQASGPFLLPCHSSPGYEKDIRDPNHQQCAGAAIYRSNTDVAKLMPPGIHKLPADREQVFATPAELLAHHREITLQEAQKWLDDLAVRVLLHVQLRKQGVQVLSSPHQQRG